MHIYTSLECVWRALVYHIRSNSKQTNKDVHEQLMMEEDETLQGTIQLRKSPSETQGDFEVAYNFDSRVRNKNLSEKSFLCFFGFH